MSSTYLTKTSTTVTDDKKFTISTWVKRSALDTNFGIFGHRDSSNSGNSNLQFGFYAQRFYMAFVSNNGADTHIYKTSNALHRDTSAWYHIVASVDSTQATADDRVKMYVNGNQITSFSASTNPPLNRTFLNSTCTIDVGKYTDGAGNPYYMDGSLSHFHYIDGTAYDASAFGETDATTGIWKPKTEPSVSYGTNGFFLKYENSGSMGTDSSGNGNNFSVSGNLTQTIDTPSNVFATLNPLDVAGSGVTFANGNTKGTSSTTWSSTFTTLAVSKGKWYAEFKWDSGTYFMPGIRELNGKSASISSSNFGDTAAPAHGYAWWSSGGEIYEASVGSQSYGNPFSTGDILGVYMDLDNSKLYFAKNGTLENSGTGFDIDTSDDIFYGFGVSLGASTASANFGNGYFGTTAVSSGNSDVNGLGTFEYDPSSGTFDGSSKDFLALCTKNINAQEYS